MKVIKDLKYTDTHEWVKLEGNRAYIGITDYAQDNLGEIIYVELPEVTTTVDAGDQFVVVESEEDSVDIYAPISGTVVEVNDELVDNPSLINESSYEAWLVVIDMASPVEADKLLSAKEYKEICE